MGGVKGLDVTDRMLVDIHTFYPHFLHFSGTAVNLETVFEKAVSWRVNLFPGLTVEPVINPLE